MFHLALTKCDIQRVALKINKFPISFITLSNELGIQLSGLWYCPRKTRRKLKEKRNLVCCYCHTEPFGPTDNYTDRYRMKELQKNQTQERKCSQSVS